MTKYADYTVHIGSDLKGLVSISQVDGLFARMHFAAYRVPSKREFWIRHCADATATDRAWAELWMARIREKWDQDGRPRAIATRRKGIYYWRVKLGRFIDDPLIQLELEMMIDSTRELETLT